MWPLKMSEVPSSVPNKMDGLANSFIREWLGLPRCLSEVGLFGRNTLQLPLRSIGLGYKQAATAIHWPGIQAGEGSDGDGAEGIH